MKSFTRQLATAFICLAMLIQVPGSVAAGQSAWNSLLRLEGKELWHIDSASRTELRNFLLAVAPEWSEHVPFYSGGKPPFHTPRYLWKLTTTHGAIRYILIGADGLSFTPSDSRAEAFVFDADGALLSYVEFSLGWRAHFFRVELGNESEFGVPLIMFQTNRADIGSKQYYALVQDKLALLRLEGDGKALRNQFVARNWTIGPKPPERTPEEWESALLSNAPTEVLRSLMWLGGRHWNLNKDHAAYSQPTDDVRKNAELVTVVRSRSRVQERLKELKGSRLNWIGDAAALALAPSDGGIFAIPWQPLYLEPKSQKDR